MKIFQFGVYVFIGGIIFVPYLCLAEDVLLISEIMYNPVGTDSKHEWVEIKNVGSVPLNISDLRLLESGVAHKITPLNGAPPTLDVGQYAIVADDAQTFLLDYSNNPDIIDKVYDSVFSLVNTGEEISITNSGGEVFDTLLYDSTMGANGTGNTLQLTDERKIIPASPTPAKENAQIAIAETQQTATSSTPVQGGTSSHSSQAEVSNYSTKPVVEISVGRERLATVHQPVHFSADVSITARRKISWNFGDGSVGSGRTVKHIFDVPGTYIVNGSLYSGSTRAFDRTKVTVIMPILELVQMQSEPEERWGIKNASDSELNMGGWQVTQERQENRLKWQIPEDTILLSNSTLPLPAYIMSENSSECLRYELDFPDETHYKTFDCPTPNSRVQ